MQRAFILPNPNLCREHIGYTVVSVLRATAPATKVTVLIPGKESYSFVWGKVRIRVNPERGVNNVTIIITKDVILDRNFP